MLSKSLDSLAAYSEVPEPLPFAPRERRKRQRAAVHWPLHFLQPGTAETLQSVTQNISSEGFYCLVEGKFVTGETRECAVTVPVHRPRNGFRTLTLHCTVRIVHVEKLAGNGASGVGCRIEDYRLIPKNGHP